MAITDDLRKTLSDPTPLYFAAGTADLAFQQVRKVPELVEQLRSEAPARFEAVRRTDPKQVQDRAAARARDVQESVQNRVNEVLGSFDTDLKKLGESAQGFALRGVGVAVEYAVKARETYERVAEHGEEAVRTWRGEDTGPSRAVEPVEAPKPVVIKDERGTTTTTTSTGRGATRSRTNGRTSQASSKPSSSASTSSSTSSTSSAASAPATPSTSPAAEKKTTAKKSTARRNGTSSRKTPPGK